MRGDPPVLDNAAVAARLERFADLLELTGANPFRVRAYRTAAEAVAGHTSLVAELDKEELLALRGIGKDLARSVRELVETGDLPQLRELEAEVPQGLLEVTRLSGVGPKRATTLWRGLGIAGLEDLEREARAGRVAELPGFGTRTEKKILGAIERARSRRGRVPLAAAEPAVARLVTALGGVAGVTRLEATGSYRRGRETVGDIDFVAVAEDPSLLMDELRHLGDVREVLASGPTKTSVVLADGLQVDLRVVEAEAYGAALIYFTGSKAHNVALRARAIERGLRLSEYGLFEVADDDTTARRLAGSSEEEVYGALELEWVPAELREGRGEVQAAAEGRLPRLVTQDDVRGDLHLHTTWSDGTADIADMVTACAARGYEYMAVTDHSQTLRMTGGLDEAKLERQWAALDELEAEHEGITVLRGLEVDILRDGTLDLSDAWLARLDIVVASVHSSFELSRDEQTSRVLRALEHQHVDVLAHPTGRILARRDPYEIDLDAVFESAARHGIAVELNAAPQRLDLGDTELMRAVSAGCRVVIDTDAHSIRGLDDMRYGVLTARRAWLTPEHVLNAWPLERLRAHLARG